MGLQLPKVHYIFARATPFYLALNAIQNACTLRCASHTLSNNVENIVDKASQVTEHALNSEVKELVMQNFKQAKQLF